MRVLVITNWFPSADFPHDGIFNERDVLLLKKDHEVEVIHLVKSKDTLHDIHTLQSGIKVKRLTFARVDPVESLKTLIALRHALLSVELVHTMAFPAIFPTWLVRLFQIRRIPWVHTEHWTGLLLRDENVINEMIKRLIKFLLKSPTKVVAVGENLAKAIGHYRRDIPVIIGNQVLLPKLRNINRSPIELNSDALNIVSVGTLTTVKGPAETILTVWELRKRGINANLRWIGSGPLREDVLILADKIGITDFVSMPGELSPKEVSTELSKADLFLLPSLVETYGIALAEAMAHGLPIVTGSNVNKSFLLPFASRMVPLRHPIALADAIVELIQSPDLPTALEISTLAKETFSESKRRKEYKRVYSEAMLIANIK